MRSFPNGARNCSPSDFIPQGGGDFNHGHRCAGEGMTIQALKTSVRLLVSAGEFDMPEQNLRVDLARMQAIPESRFIIRNMRRLQPGHATHPARVLRPAAERRV